MGSGYEIEKAKHKAYWKAYRAKPENKLKKAEQTKRYHAQEGVLERKKIKSRENYLSNKEKFKSRCKKRREERKGFLDDLAVKYGCQNVNCNWNGKYLPCQLDFHHLDPKTKRKEVAKMHTASWETIINEVNKCVILCRNCHAEVHHGALTLDETLLCHINEKDIKGEKWPRKVF
jgi:hypothetical protein